jgi:hypothetical protein
LHLPDWRTRGLTFPDIIDSSMRAKFVECPRSFQHQYIEGLVRRGTSIHLTFGASYARGLEVFRKSYFGLDGLSVPESLELALHSARAEWSATDTLPTGLHPTKTLDRCLQAIQATISQYPPEIDHITPHIEAGSPCVEFTFALPVGIRHPETGEPLLVSGRFDMLARLAAGQSPASTAAFYVFDDKTTSQLGQSWINNFRLRAQLSCYVWGARQFGYPVAGAIVRGISILKTSFGFAEVIENRPDWMIDVWEDQMRRDILRMIRCWEDSHFDQSLDTACTSYGGCQFLDLCANHDPEPWKAADFEPNHYHPLSPRAKDGQP